MLFASLEAFQDGIDLEIQGGPSLHPMRWICFVCDPAQIKIFDVFDGLVKRGDGVAQDAQIDG